MTCSSCVGTVERALRSVPGVLDASVNLLTETAIVEFDISKHSQSENDNRNQDEGWKTLSEALLSAVEDVGFDASIPPEGNPQPIRNPSLPVVTNIVRHRFTVEGMTCASCSGTIERHLRSLPGVEDVSVNLLLKVAAVKMDLEQISVNQIEEELSDLGFPATVQRNTSSSGQVDMDGNPIGGEGGGGGSFLDLREQSQTFLDNQRRTIRRHLADFAFCAVFTVPVVLLSMVFPYIKATSDLIHEPVAGSRLAWGSLLMGLLTTPVQFGVGGRFFRAAWKSLRHKSADMNTLIAIGTGAAYLFAFLDTIQRLTQVLDVEDSDGDGDGDDHDQGRAHKAAMGNTHFYETAAMLITFVCMGRLLEAIAKSKTSSAITELMNLQPSVARLVTLKNTSINNSAGGGRGGTKPIKPGDVLQVWFIHSFFGVL